MGNPFLRLLVSAGIPGQGISWDFYTTLHISMRYTLFSTMNIEFVFLKNYVKTLIIQPYIYSVIQMHLLPPYCDNQCVVIWDTSAVLRSLWCQFRFLGKVGLSFVLFALSRIILWRIWTQLSMLLKSIWTFLVCWMLKVCMLAERGHADITCTVRSGIRSGSCLYEEHRFVKPLFA